MKSYDADLAKLLIEHSVQVKPKDKVVICTSDLYPIELIRQLLKQTLQKGAFVYLDIMGLNWILGRSSWGDLAKTYLDYAKAEQLKNPPKVYSDIVDWGDKFIRITNYDNYSHLAESDPKKLQIFNKAYEGFFNTLIDKKDWVLTYYPTPAMAQLAGMSEESLKEFYFKACLTDYEQIKKNGEKLTKLMDKTKIIRIIGQKTDLKLDITGRLAENAYGKNNIPDGEVFLAPVHTKTEGYIYYDLPNFKDGVDVIGAYLEFKNGKVIKAKADQGEQVLLNTLETDKGAKYLGELGLGLNYGIKKPMRQTLFDEKIGGTIHVTLGKSYTTKRGGSIDNPNKSAVHWDLVKDMRKPNSLIYADGKLVFKNGKWLI
ncbi:MAG: aminopeptidase [Patescibacteria group bacterium]|nr:MAG: aminopeptidase [Patescibacteria group bacterium]